MTKFNKEWSERHDPKGLFAKKLSIQLEKIKLSKEERKKIQEKEWIRLMEQIKIRASKANY